MNMFLHLKNYAEQPVVLSWSGTQASVLQAGRQQSETLS